MQIKKEVAFTVFIVFITVTALNGLRAINAIGTEYDFLIRGISTISLVLTGIFAGIVISEKKIQPKKATTNLILVILGLSLIPLLTIITTTILTSFQFSVDIKIAITFIFPTSCASIYMFYMIKKQKRQFFTSGETE